MPFGSVARPVRAVFLVSVLLAVLAAPGALAAKSRSVSLTVAITGKGTVRLSTGRQFACAASCKRTVLVRAGSMVTLSTQPGTGWKFGTWAGACRGTASKCNVPMLRAERVGVNFLAPGIRANPIPLGTVGNIDGFWLLKVVSTHAEGRDLVLLLSATATGSDLGLYQLALNIFILGTLHDEYSLDDSCAPSPDFIKQGSYYDPFLLSPAVREGETITGYVCFKIAHSPRATFLFVEPPLRSLTPPDDPPYWPPDSEARWFALR